MRRGQVAMEFIMTYGWAILVVLVAIGALAYFGVLNPGRYLPEKCIFSTGLTCRGFAFEDDGAGNMDARFTLTNALGDTVIIGQGNISARYQDTIVGCTPDDGWSGGQFTIASDVSEGFSCTFSGSPGAGGTAKVSVTLNYTTSQGVYGKRAVGDITGTVQ